MHAPGAQAGASGALQGPCSRGFAETAVTLAPECARAWPTLRALLGAVTKAFLGKNKQAGAMKDICARTRGSVRALEHDDVREALGREAQGLGFPHAYFNERPLREVPRGGHGAPALVGAGSAHVAPA